MEEGTRGRFILSIREPFGRTIIGSFSRAFTRKQNIGHAHLSRLPAILEQKLRLRKISRLPKSQRRNLFASRLIFGAAEVCSMVVRLFWGQKIARPGCRH